jgi:chromosome partitioning protein
MPSIALLSQKGGSGKTTLACHLAVTAGDALIVDVDKQRSATGWWETREAEMPDLVTARPEDVARAIAASRRTWVLVDSAPWHDEGAVAAAEAVDFILIPSRPSILDLRAVAPTVAIAKESGKPAAIVLNACPPGRGVAEAAVTTEARRALRAYGLPVCPAAITQRAAFAHALSGGQAVTEFEPEGRAAQEIIQLWEWLRAQSEASSPGPGRLRRAGGARGPR